jgi:hypothetical protein
MKNWTAHVALTTFLMVATVPAFGDIPNPNANKKRTTKDSALMSPMRIEPNDQASEAKLVIPRDVLRQLRASGDVNDSGNPEAAVIGYSGLSRTQTVMAGIFLSLAFAFGGVWFVNTRKRPEGFTRVALGIALLSFSGLTTTVVLANMGPPSVARSLTSRILIPDAQWYGVYGSVKVEVVNDGDQITLVLPKPKDQPK